MNLWTDITTWLCSAAAAALITALAAVWRDTRSRRDSLQCAVRMLLYDRLKEKCRAYLAQGFIPAEDMEDVMSMHEVYHRKLKGNGYLDTLMDRVKALPEGKE